MNEGEGGWRRIGLRAAVEVDVDFDRDHSRYGKIKRDRKTKEGAGFRLILVACKWQ